MRHAGHKGDGQDVVELLVHLGTHDLCRLSPFGGTLRGALADEIAQPSGHHAQLFHHVGQMERLHMGVHPFRGEVGQQRAYHHQLLPLRQPLAAHIRLGLQEKRFGGNAHLFQRRRAVGADGGHQINDEFARLAVLLVDLYRLNPGAGFHYDVRQLLHIGGKSVQQSLAHAYLLRPNLQNEQFCVIHQAGILCLVEFSQSYGIDFQITSHVVHFLTIETRSGAHSKDFLRHENIKIF